MLPPTEPVNPDVPAIDVVLSGPNGKAMRRTFLVDSGADVSMAPRRLCELARLDGSAGWDSTGSRLASECASSATL